MEVLIPIIGLGLTLGLRHGVDWDHIAAITDIAGSAAADEQHMARRRSWAMLLATAYALGHAALVIVLGILAIWFGTILPEWIDPIMERVVGATLLFLAFWIIYSIWRDGTDFRLQSRWMAIFAAAEQAWHRVRGAPHDHATSRFRSYGLGTAFGVGVIHGIGAETGSQALLLAAASGATGTDTATALLLAFTVGLIVSNSLIAAFSVFGFVSARSQRVIYMAIGILTAAFSLVVGLLFITGNGGMLPDFEAILTGLFGSPFEE